eukprot:6884_1
MSASNAINEQPRRKSFNATIKNTSLNTLSYIKNRPFWSWLFLQIMIITILFTLSTHYDYQFFQNSKYVPITSSNIYSNNIQKHVTANITECLHIATTKVVELQYHTLNAALIIEANLTQTSKCFGLMKPIIVEWYDKITKIYMLINSQENEKLTAIPKQFQLFINNTVITSKHSFLKINTLSHDLLIWFNCNNMIPETHCSYSNAMNVTLGSNEWIKHKTMHIPINWIDYRLGDMIQDAHWRNEMSGYKYHKANFPDSIAVQYMEQIQSGKDMDLKLLLQIISTRKQLYPLNNTLVVHLRTGDVLDVPCSYRTGQNTMNLIYDPISVFDGLKSKLIFHNLSNVVLVTGFHIQGNHTNSLNYIIKIKKWFQQNNFSVSFRINENVDNDFVFMCNSQFFIQAAGKFSNTIARVIRIRKGIVFNFHKKGGFMGNGPPKMQKCLDEMKMKSR